MKVAELITQVRAKYHNAYADTDLIDWTNDLEREIYAQHIKEIKEDSISLVLDQANYAITGYEFEDILVVKVNGQVYKKRDVTNYLDTVESFYKNQGELYLYPVPDAAVADGLKVQYLGQPTTKTDALKATQDLELADRFANIYRYYLFTQICLHNKEFGEANNWTEQYNAALGKFLVWYWKGRPQNNVTINKKRWGL